MISLGIKEYRPHPMEGVVWLQVKDKMNEIITERKREREGKD